MSDASKAIFLSYASQDAQAAQRICDALRAAGVEVWFDQSELRGGDAWDQKIRRQIKDCALFVPVVSQNTQARREGYFRLEWKLAEDRTHLMAKGTPFVVPVCVDDTKDWDALVPDSFTQVQWTRLPGGEASEKFCARVVQLLGGVTTPPMPAPSRRSEPTEGAAASRAGTREKKTPAWLTAVIVVVPMLVGLALAWRVLPHRGGEAPTAKKPVEATPAPVAEFPRDPELKRAHQLIRTLDSIPEDYALAEDIVKPLLNARPNDPEVVTVAAEVSQEFLTRGFDVSQARRAQTQRLTERAVALAPDNPEALGSLARYLSFINAQFGRAEQLARRAVELDHTDARHQRTLYYILFRSKSAAEADAFGARMAAAFPHEPLVAYDIARRYKDADDLVHAEEWFDKTLAIAPVGFAMTWKAWFLLEVHGDVKGMKAMLDRIPDRQRTNARVVNAFAVHAGITGQTETALRLLNAVADTWLTDFDFTGPTALLFGDLLKLDGRDELARVQYEAALAEVHRMEAADPADLRPRRAELWVQLGLGHRDEARAALRMSLQSLPRPYRWDMRNSWWSSAIRASLILDERGPALELLKEACSESPGRLLLRNLFQVDPQMARWRDDPEIAALLAEPKK